MVCWHPDEGGDSCKRDYLLRITGIKFKAVIFKAKLLAAAVELIWNDMRNGAPIYVNPVTEQISKSWRLLEEYHATVTFATPQLREFMFEIPRKLIADWS